MAVKFAPSKPAFVPPFSRSGVSFDAFSGKESHLLKTTHGSLYEQLHWILAIVWSVCYSEKRTGKSRNGRLTTTVSQHLHVSLFFLVLLFFCMSRECNQSRLF